MKNNSIIIIIVMILAFFIIFLSMYTQKDILLRQYCNSKKAIYIKIENKDFCKIDNRLEEITWIK